LPTLVSSTFGGAALNKESYSEKKKRSQTKICPPGIKILQKYIIFIIWGVLGSSFAFGGSRWKKAFISYLSPHMDINQHPYLFFGVSMSAPVSSSKGDKRLASVFDADVLDDDQGLEVGSLDRNEKLYSKS
jgi:hypothetical protein